MRESSSDFLSHVVSMFQDDDDQLLVSLQFRTAGGETVGCLLTPEVAHHVANAMNFEAANAALLNAYVRHSPSREDALEQVARMRRVFESYGSNTDS